jgi:hypothetical protein
MLAGVVLGTFAIWMLAPEVAMLPRKSVALNPPSICLAARIGIVRGDLWSQCAFGLAEALWDNKRDADPDKTLAIQRARSSAEKALILSPHDAKSWLVLAFASSLLSPSNPQAMASLKMAYYTGANRPELIPQLLQMSVSSEALTDPELEQLFREEIAKIIRGQPRLTPAIVAAYKSASLRGKTTIETVLREHDPGLVAQLGSQSEPPRPKGESRSP